jgi:hypothetical protein
MKLSRRWVFLSTLLTATAVLVVVPLEWKLSQPQADIGSIPPIGRDSALPARAGKPSQAANVPVSSARLADHASVLTPMPARIRIAAIALVGQIIPVGITSRGMAMEIPPNVQTVGWYRYGPSPGQPGSAILVGHVDSSAQGPGIFFRLRELLPGAVVRVDFRAEAPIRFRVVARRFYPKGDLPPIIFARDGRPVLTLITCGGTFDPIRRQYAENIVVFAVPER